MVTHIWPHICVDSEVKYQTICDSLQEKEQFPAKVDFAIITPKIVVNFGRSHLSTPGDSRICYLAAGTNTSVIHP